MKSSRKDFANVVSQAIYHIKNGEEYYTQEELVSALKAQVSALQDGVVGTTLQTCQCEAHQTILDVTIREYVAKLLDIAASPPAVENQLSELIICILQILNQTTDIEVLSKTWQEIIPLWLVHGA